MAQARRTYLGKVSSMVRRQRVYRTADALEIDDSEDYDIRRFRLFYDEILLVTYHQRVSFGYLTLLVALAGLSGLAALGVGTMAGWTAAILTFAFTGLPCLVFSLLHLVLKVDVVSVYGRRTLARMEFAFRKERAREVYVLVGRLAREHQDRLAREIAAEQRRQSPASAPSADTA